MNKVYSCDFLSYFSSRLLWYSPSVHVLTLWWWVLLKYTSHSLHCFSNWLQTLMWLRQWLADEIRKNYRLKQCKSVRDRQEERMGICLLGALVASLQQGARWSSSSALYPLPASVHTYSERQHQSLFVEAPAGFSLPVCVCMSVFFDHHWKLYTIHQHLLRRLFENLILIIAVIC